MAIRSLSAVAFFVIMYFVLLGLALGLIVLCGYLAFQLVLLYPSFITLIPGLGLVGMGFFILFFLVKFIFSKNKTDRSHFHELSEHEAPEIFKMVRSITNELDTHFPKKIYLTTEVNASVFYDSNFWSMFLPIRKNLTIGVGLINSVTISELRATLAHEFGHFSQKSMKIGSFVHNVNHVIFNMLYDNDGMGQTAEMLSNTNFVYSFFAKLSISLIQVIQSVLKELYKVVNINYMGLSKEMEFHADEIAAGVAGSEPLAISLMRLDFANYSMKMVLAFYEQKIESSVCSKNIFPNHWYAMNYLGQYQGMKFEHDLPKVTDEHQNKFEKSKLVIENIWDSHPRVEDRVAKLQKLNLPDPLPNHEKAITLLENASDLQETVTRILFSEIEYKSDVRYLSPKEFENSFNEFMYPITFDRVFNSYYDSKPVFLFQMNLPMEAPKEWVLSDIHEAYNAERISDVYTSAALNNDIEQIGITSREDISHYMYDNRWYAKNEKGDLTNRLRKALVQVDDKILENDIKIYRYFKSHCEQNGKLEEFDKLYLLNRASESAYQENYQVFADMFNSFQFINFQLPFDQIHRNIAELKNAETKLVESCRGMLAGEIYETTVQSKHRKQLDKFINTERKYFAEPNYLDQDFIELFEVHSLFQFLNGQTLLIHKKNILSFMAEEIAVQPQM